MYKKILHGFMDGLIFLGIMSMGGFFIILFADAMKMPYQNVGLYCFGFSILTFIITFPYYYIQKKLNKGKKG